jgi:alpha-beta hydrolase superfamily lysophospholipase
MKLLKIIPPLVGTAFAGVLGTALYASSQINPVPRRTFESDYVFTPWEFRVPFEDITLRAPDGLNLRGWWLHCEGAQSVVIGCHGHLGQKDTLLGIGTSLWRAGHHVLLFDFRGRGNSDPWPNTLISREVDDLLTFVQYTRERMPGAPIGLVGFSMGASVSLLGAAQEPAITAVVADSPFTSAAEVVHDNIRATLPIGAGAVMMLTEALIARQHGYSLSQTRPIEAVAQLAPRPLLLIHATGDSMIPVAHAHRIFAAAQEPKELWIYEGVEHCGAYFDNRSLYVERVGAFFHRHLGMSR